MQQPIALVTGCSAGGIGHSLCMKLVSKGYRVFATARNEDSMDPALKQVAEFVKLDVTDPESIAAAAKQVATATGGRLNVLINNAGTGANSTPLLEVDIEKAKRFYGTNVFGVLAVTQAFAPMIIDTANTPGNQQAAIVNVSSISGVRAFPFRGIYGSTKAAVNALSDALRNELAGFNVKVICVVPGMVGTQIRSKQADLAGPLATSPSSPYAHLKQRLADFTAASRKAQAGGSMKPDDLATKVVQAIESSHPPAFLYLAKYSWRYRWFIPHFPVWFVDWVFWRSFGSHLVKYRTNAA